MTRSAQPVTSINSDLLLTFFKFHKIIELKVVVLPWHDLCDA